MPVEIVAAPAPGFDTGRMQCQVKAIPAIQIDTLALAIDVFKDDAPYAFTFVQHNPDLLQLTDNIGIPVTRHRVM
jgi:hypothetical protein